jgi:hypothetical protein
MRKLAMILLVALVVGVVGCPGAGDQNVEACRFVNDGECDDGRLGAVTNQCPPGTDEADCADVDPTVCQTTEDGECDDGRPGADFAICAPGTDEVDCADIPEPQE